MMSEKTGEHQVRCLKLPGTVNAVLGSVQSGIHSNVRTVGTSMGSSKELGASIHYTPDLSQSTGFNLLTCQCSGYKNKSLLD